LNIRTTNHLAHRLGIPFDFLTDVYDDHDDLYNDFYKRIGRKKRHLYACRYRLRQVLVAVKEVLSEVCLPKEIVGGRRGGTIRDFAAPHVGQQVVMEFDYVNFYPSVRHRSVYELFCEKLGCSPDVARLLTRLTTAHGRLPQGFPTSTHIGNLLIRDEVANLSKLCEEHHAYLTVWVDNIVISGPFYIQRLVSLVKRMLERTGLRIHDPKIMPSSHRQTICGVTVNQGLSNNRAKRELIEQDIWQIAEGRMCDVCEGDSAKLLRRLNGRVDALAQVDRRQMRKLRHRLRGVPADWECTCRGRPGPAS